MKIEARTYATAAIRDLLIALPKHKRVIAVAPTGAGKTVIVSQLIHKLPRRRVLFVAHRLELVDQAHRTLAALGIKAGVIMGSDERVNGTARVDLGARVQVAGVQTVAARGLGAWRPDVIVFDEAHRTMAASYLEIATLYPRAQVLGVTATPIRTDGRGLGDFYRHLLVIAQPSTLHASGHLAKPRTFSAPPEIVAEVTRGLRGAIRNQTGDYTSTSAARAMDRATIIGSVVSEAKRLAPSVPKVVFAANVQHSQHLVRAFKRAGVSAEHLDGETPLEERAAILDRLRSGKTEVVCNVDVLSEGWDMPALGAVIIARPTRSIARFLQMAGRCTRPYRGRVPVVIDHGANVQRLDVLPGEDRAWSLDATQPKNPGNVMVCGDCAACVPCGCRECPHCGAELRSEAERVAAEVTEREAQLELITEARMAKLRGAVSEVAASVGGDDAWIARVTAQLAPVARGRAMAA